MYLVLGALILLTHTWYDAMDSEQRRLRSLRHEGYVVEPPMVYFLWTDLTTVKPDLAWTQVTSSSKWSEADKFEVRNRYFEEHVLKHIPLGIDADSLKAEWMEVITLNRLRVSNWFRARHDKSLLSHADFDVDEATYKPLAILSHDNIRIPVQIRAKIIRSNSNIHFSSFEFISAWITVLSPYFLMLFVRSVLWSIRNLKKVEE